MSHYRHNHKAGNFADVHKHWLLSLLLSHPRGRSDSLSYIESHAGNGIYRLDSSPDAAHGIAKIWDATAPSSYGLRQYLHTVRKQNPMQALQRYPGSPAIARYLLRPNDTAVLFDNQPGVITELAQHLQHDPRFTLHPSDGYRGIAGILPLTSSALVLIDPPYEQENEYRRVSWLLHELLQQEQQPLIAVWYPLFHDEVLRPEAKTPNSWFSELVPREREGKRMCGSGILLVNAPNPLLHQAEREGNWLAQRLQAEIRYWRPS